MDLQVSASGAPAPATRPARSIIPRLPFHSNPDILDEICEYLSYDHEYDLEDIRRGRNSLLWVALTCKAFLEPALDRLWRQLDSLFPLLKVLPAFMQSDGTYVLRGSISNQEWARFDWYGRRVRKFCYTRDPDTLDIAMHVYFRLAQLRATPILPSLRHLHCPSTSQKDFLISGICLFLSPSLQSLDFENISSVEDKLCGTVLHTLHCDNAPMEKIILRGTGLSHDTVCMAIRFEHLKTLELAGMGESLNMDILEKIGCLPWLVDLAIDFTNSGIPLLENDIGLKDLRSLMVTASAPFIQAFIPRIASPNLETFVAVTPSNPPVDKKDFLTDVVARWRDTLRGIALIHQQFEPNIDNVAEELNINALTPLLPLRKLSYVRLEGYLMELHDGNIVDFAMSWPELHTLLLPHINASRSRPTIVSLRTLAQLCPHLRNLRIPLNTIELAPFVSTGIPHSPPHDLHELTIASSDDPWELRDLLHLARHIDYIFPKLRWVYAHEGHDADRWMQVHEMIQMYQAVRKEAVTLEHVKQQTRTY